MSSPANGRHGERHDANRRLRVDELSTILEGTNPRGARRGNFDLAKSPSQGPGYSGRTFVVVAVIAVLVLSGSLYLAFREWRTRYRQRAEYGAAHVAPAIDALAGVVPPGIDPARWRDAIARTHAMLRTVTGSNLLGLAEMHELRAAIDRVVARAQARPETAPAELASLWDDMCERAEFLLRDFGPGKPDRHPRPSILPSYGDDRVAPALDPLAGLEPPGVEPGRWRDGVLQTRTLLRAVTASRWISTMRMKELRASLDRSVAHARARPESAVDDLAEIWDALERAEPSMQPGRPAPDGVAPRPPRPGIFPARR